MLHKRFYCGKYPTIMIEGIMEGCKNFEDGTNDRRIITCTKNGISLSLAKIIVEKYMDYIQIDVENDTLQFRDGIIAAMEEAKENEILICELQYFL